MMIIGYEYLTLHANIAGKKQGSFKDIRNLKKIFFEEIFKNDFGNRLRICKKERVVSIFN